MGRERGRLHRERDRESETKKDKQKKTHTHKQNKEDLETQPGFPGGSAGKETPCNARGPSFIPGSGRSSREGNGNLLQCSFLENPVNRGAWWATVHRVTQSERLKQQQSNITKICAYEFYEFYCFSSCVWTLIHLN